VAEDVHQQRVGAAAGIQLAEAPIIIHAREAFGNGQDFVETPAPPRTRDDRAITCGMKVAVRAVVESWAEDHTSGFHMAPAGDVSVCLGVSYRALCEIESQLRGVAGHRVILMLLAESAGLDFVISRSGDFVIGFFKSHNQESPNHEIPNEPLLLLTWCIDMPLC
jgi:hypothetical protein